MFLMNLNICSSCSIRFLEIGDVVRFLEIGDVVMRPCLDPMGF
jgi:hypothetical protein